MKMNIGESLFILAVLCQVGRVTIAFFNNPIANCFTKFPDKIHEVFLSLFSKILRVTSTIYKWIFVMFIACSSCTPELNYKHFGMCYVKLFGYGSNIM